MLAAIRGYVRGGRALTTDATRLIPVGSGKNRRGQERAGWRGARALHSTVGVHIDVSSCTNSTAPSGASWPTTANRASSSSAVQTLSVMIVIVPAWSPSGSILAVRGGRVPAVSSDQPEGHKSAGHRRCESSPGFSCKALYRSSILLAASRKQQVRALPRVVAPSDRRYPYSSPWLSHPLRTWGIARRSTSSPTPEPGHRGPPPGVGDRPPPHGSPAPARRDGERSCLLRAEPVPCSFSSSRTHCRRVSR